MNYRISVILFILAGLLNLCFAQIPRNEMLFDEDWKFYAGDVQGAEKPDFNDYSWRDIDLPHDWSIENLPPQEERPAPELLVVTGSWLFQKGDEAEWKEADFDDSRWQRVMLPDTWERHSNYTDNDVYGWYRRHIDIPAECRSQDFDLLLGRIDDVDETFLNGQRIGGTGSFPPDYRTAYDVQRRYRVPASLVRGGGSDVLAVRVFDRAGEGGIYATGTKSMRFGPFDSALSEGGASTGYFVGGTGWYRKHFTLVPADADKHITICFDGVYMNADIWLNGRHLGNHPYGYTSFVYNLTPYLKPAGQENVLVVQVKNTGRNSRWYSGSGIYRHVWLAVADPVHIPFWGVYVTTPDVSKTNAKVQMATTIENGRSADATIQLRTHLLDPNGQAVAAQDTEVCVTAHGKREFIQAFSVNNPVLWSLDNPALYQSEVELIEDQSVLDQYETTFGIRTLRFSVEKGFELNDEVVKLKGGCMHHDNGPLGAAAIDRAEERRVQLMKTYGYNAIRTSHNPPSPAFLDACDRYGILVMDEAFDCWEEGKNSDDYGRYFNDWWQRDLESMILRDRNHPCIIMWSIGNEIPQRGDERGFVIAKQLRDEVHRLDPTRPVTEAVCALWDDRPWSDVQKMFTFLDVGGYNYQWRQYVQDHKEFPGRIIVGTESFPAEAFENWQVVLDHPWVIGDFVWTSMDYLGETGIGNARLNDDPDQGFLRSWPWFNAFCGDIDLCGFKKPQMLYKDVLWRNSKLEMAVHTPIPKGKEEIVSAWGWPDELQSWNWNGYEGHMMDVRVFSYYPIVRLELNGKVIAEQTINEDSKLTAHFKVPYEPGLLRAIALENGAVAAVRELKTTGVPVKIKLTADRTRIKADRNDLSYVKIEIIDNQGELIPDAAVPVTLTVSGAGEIAGSGNACPHDMESFNAPVCKTFHGKALVILRPLRDKKNGTIILRAEANGLTSAEVQITMQ